MTTSGQEDGLTPAAWRKSSRTSPTSNDCVEVATVAQAVAVRDSKDPDGPMLVISPADWQKFTGSVKARRHDRT